MSNVSSFSNLNFHATFAIPFVGFASHLPFIAGVRFVDARSASRMIFGVNIFGCFLIW